MAKKRNVSVGPGRYKFLPKLLMYAGLLLLVFSGTIWWTKIYNNPRQVFSAMLNNSLSTPSITRTVRQQSQGNILEQDIRLSLGAQNLSHVVTTITQGSGDNTARVVTESIGTIEDDYTRYIEINTEETNAEGKPLNFEGIVGVWAKSDQPLSGQQSNTRYFNEALLGVVPFANLDADKRQELLKLMQEQNVFNTDFTKVGQIRLDGRKQYVYRVTVNPKPYVTMLQAFTKELGVGQVEGLDQSNFENVAPLQVELAVDVLSRQLTRVGYAGNGREETYSGHGIKTIVTIPSQTIPASELQNRLQTLR